MRRNRTERSANLFQHRTQRRSNSSTQTYLTQDNITAETQTTQDKPRYPSTTRMHPRRAQAPKHDPGSVDTVVSPPNTGRQGTRAPLADTRAFLSPLVNEPYDISRRESNAKRTRPARRRVFSVGAPNSRDIIRLVRAIPAQWCVSIDIRLTSKRRRADWAACMFYGGDRERSDVLGITTLVVYSSAPCTPSVFTLRRGDPRLVCFDC